MLRYRTEILVPGDRYVCVQLPDHFPEGRATVTIAFEAAEAAEAVGMEETDREDIEWWEEFDEMEAKAEEEGI